MLMPGLGFDRPAFEMCMKRTSAVQFIFPARKCMPTAPAVVKLMRDVPGGASVLVNNAPPPRSMYGTKRPCVSKSQISAKGFTAAPYAVLEGIKSIKTGTASTAYSNRPRRYFGPNGSVITQP